MKKKNSFTGGTRGKGSQKPPKAPKAATPPRADDGVPPEPGMEGADMQECEHCEGSGEMPDGSMCESCGGTGKVAMKAEDGDGDEAEGADDGDEAEGSGGDDGDDDDGSKEAESFERLRVKLGLPEGATRAQVLLAASAQPAAADVDAKLDELVAQKFAAESAKRAKAQSKRQAQQLVADAMKGGYADEDKEALEQLASSGPKGMKAAERIAAPFVAKARQLFARVANDRTLSSDARSAIAGASVKFLGNGVKKITYTTDLSHMAKTLAAKEGLTYEAALDRVMKTPEGKAAYQQYLHQQNA